MKRHITPWQGVNRTQESGLKGGNQVIYFINDVITGALIGLLYALAAMMENIREHLAERSP